MQKVREKECFGERVKMKMPGLILLLGLFLLTALPANGEMSTYELVLKGKRCQERENQMLDCDYRIGKTLHISIAGIGLPDTSVTFMKSDYDGDFYATMGVLHGCVIVKRGPKDSPPNVLDGPGSLFDFAFISPRSGKVYKGWQECQSGM